jgi:hypothetical protein
MLGRAGPQPVRTSSWRAADAPKRAAPRAFSAPRSHPPETVAVATTYPQSRASPSQSGITCRYESLPATSGCNQGMQSKCPKQVRTPRRGQTVGGRSPGRAPAAGCRRKLNSRPPPRGLPLAALPAVTVVPAVPAPPRFFGGERPALLPRVLLCPHLPHQPARTRRGTPASSMPFAPVTAANAGRGPESTVPSQHHLPSRQPAIAPCGTSYWPSRPTRNGGEGENGAHTRQTA